jgi:hypothetical protein
MLKEDPAALATALCSREVHNIAPYTLISHDAVCMSYCVGIDNTRLIPPFMPIGRGEDSVFGAMLGFSDRGALFAHLPLGVLHDSSRASAYGDGNMPSAHETRLADVLLAFVADASRFVARGSIAQRLRRLGEYFVDIGGFRANEFIAAVMAVQLRLRCGQIDKLETFLAGASGDVTHLHSALNEYRSAFRASVASASFFLPIEFRGAGSLLDGYRSTQAFIADLGQLMRIWPELWDFAAAANGTGAQTQ